jgi:hypothetical protein
MAAIGPTFGQELAAAGVSGEGICWNTVSGEIYFREDVPSSRRAAAIAVRAAHDATKSISNAAVLEQLAEIDATTLRAVRGLREFIIVQAQVTDALIVAGALGPNAKPISDNVGIKKVRELEALAATLRAQLLPE